MFKGSKVHVGDDQMQPDGFYSSFMGEESPLLQDSWYKQLKKMYNSSSIEDFLYPKSDWLRQNRIAERLIKLQTKDHEESPLFNAVLRNDLNKLKTIIKEDKDPIKLLQTRDAVGASVFHLSYLFENYEICHWLVENYPDLACDPYSEICPPDVLSQFINDKTYNVDEDSAIMPYAGENILHMTVIRRNLKETRWILDFYRDHNHSVPGGLAKLLTGNATGTFFDSCGDFYFGNYPLHFAVCANDKAIFDLVLTYASSINPSDFHDMPSSSGKGTVEILANTLGSKAIFMCDDDGNNCLHFCVIHNLENMYTHVKNTAEDIITRELKTAHCNALRYGEPYRYKANNGKEYLQLPKVSDADEMHGFYPEESKVLFPTDVEQNVFDSWLQKEARKKVEQRLLRVLNHAYHSPLTLAASMLSKSRPSVEEDVEKLQQDKLSMLEHMLIENREERWHFGPITCNLLNLEGIEFPYHRSCYRSTRFDPNIPRYGVIEWLCKTDSYHGVTIPEIARLIDAKWDRIGKSFFLQDFYLHSLVLILITIISCFPGHTPTANPSTTGEWTVTVVYPITAFILLLMALFELPHVIKYRLDYWGMYGGVRGSAKFEKFCRTFIMISFTILCITKTNEAYHGHPNFETLTHDDDNGERVYHYEPLDNPSTSVPLACCVILTWIYLYFFLMAFDSTGPFVLTIYRIVSQDIPHFLKFYLVVLIAFACPISVLSNQGHPDGGYGFYRLLLTLWNLIKITVQADTTNDTLDYDSFPHDVQWLFDILITGFNVIVTLMMLNLLIAMITSTYEIYTSSKGGLILMEKYNIMLCTQRSSTHGNINFPLIKYFLDLFQWKKGDLMEKYAVKIQENDDVEPVYAFEYQVVDSHWWDDEAIQSRLDETEKDSKVTLLLIDPQIDFHPEGGTEGTSSYHPRGSLFVPGANEDSERIASMIEDNIDKISEIFVTLDSHHKCHISHAVSWVDAEGCHPTPFTAISHQSILEGQWMPSREGIDEKTYQFNLEWAKEYTSRLEKGGRFMHCIWPEHCIIGSAGHAVVPVINDALQKWASKTGKAVQYIMKGTNNRTEMYSAIRAEVDVKEDPSTGLNVNFLGKLKISDKILVCGQAKSHCVNFTLTDLVKYWHSDISKLVLLSDGSSPVTGYGDQGKEFEIEMARVGVVVTTCDQAFSPNPERLYLKYLPGSVNADLLQKQATINF